MTSAMWAAHSLTIAGGAGLLLMLSQAAAPGEPNVDAILRAAMARIHAARTFAAELTVTVNPPGELETRLRGSVAAMKPNFLRIELGGTRRLVFAADGKQYATLDGEVYKVEPLAAAPEGLVGIWEAEIDAFFGGEKVFPKGKVTSAGTDSVDGVDCDVVKVEVEGERPMLYAIGRRDGLIHRGTQLLTAEGGAGFRQVNTLRRIRLGVPFESKAFIFNPPSDARRYEAPDYGAKLVPVGCPAPRFVVRSREGGDLALAELLRGKKALVLNFWYADCPTCRSELPRLQQLYAALKDGGLAVLAVNGGDALDDVEQCVKEAGLTFPIGRDGRPTSDGRTPAVFDLYGVQAYPTNYLLDGEGRVVFRSVGFNEAGLKSALSKLGLTE